MQKRNKYSVVATLVGALVLGLPVQALAAPTVNLGTADNFAVLAGTAVTNVPTSAISGDVGLSPASGSNYAGLTAAEVTGTIYAVDSAGPAGSMNNPALLTTAKNDLTTAYNDAAGRPTTATIGTALGGTVLTEGVYDSSAGTFELAVGSTLTLNGQANADAVFIFKMASTLTTGSASQVVLINGTRACNVFWQVGSSASLGTNSTFKGNILALTSADLTTGANVEGSVLARNGAVTLDSNTITNSTCTTSTPTTPIDSAPGNTVAAADSAFDAAATATTLPDAGVGMAGMGGYTVGFGLLYGLWMLRRRR